MRRVREVLRLRFGVGVSGREIALRLGIAPSTVRETLKRASAAGLSWPLRDDLSDAVLEDRLYGRARLPLDGVHRCLPRARCVLRRRRHRGIGS